MRAFLVLSAITATLHAQSNHLVAHVAFEGNFADTSPSAIVLANFGVTLTTDRCNNPGAAGEFHHDWLLGNATQLPSRQQTGPGTYAALPRTVALWFYLETAQRTLFLGYGGGLCGTSYLLAHNAGPSYNNQLVAASHCNIQDLAVTPPSPIQLHRWYHFAAVTSSAGTELFIDGASIGSSSAFQVSSTDVAGKDFVIGSAVAPNGLGEYHDPNGAPLWGHLDDVRIYDVALTPSEILALFTCGITLENAACEYCPPSIGSLDVRATQTPNEGNLDFRITCNRAPSHAIGIGVLDLSSMPPVGGPGVPICFPSPTIVTLMSDGAGRGNLPLPIPDSGSGAFVGLKVYTQFLWLDTQTSTPCSPSQVVASALYSVTVAP
jgi:hypothetical protein